MTILKVKAIAQQLINLSHRNSSFTLRKQLTNSFKHKSGFKHNPIFVILKYTQSCYVDKVFHTKYQLLGLHEVVSFLHIFN